jgi:DNA-binding MarR family transcriptional regulator
MYMHPLDMAKKPSSTGIHANNLPMLPCLCGSMRRASRALTQLYERALAPRGLSATQMTILQALARAGEVTQGRLGEMLAMDSTSLTRTLSIMRREEWLAERRGQDRREKLIRLSNPGVKKLREAEPVWERVQLQVHEALGEQDWKQLMELAHRVAVATQRGDQQ